MTRYSGKPFLRLLECYVLWVIGHISQEEESALLAMTPNLEATFKVSGSWQDIIASTARLDEADVAKIKELWKSNSEIAKSENINLSPQEFAEMFVDENFT